jgi:hypothetical protein
MLAGSMGGVIHPSEILDGEREYQHDVLARTRKAATARQGRIPAPSSVVLTG